MGEQFAPVCREVDDRVGALKQQKQKIVALKWGQKGMLILFYDNEEFVLIIE
jgi:hypothetical protein